MRARALLWASIAWALVASACSPAEPGEDAAAGQAAVSAPDPLQTGVRVRTVPVETGRLTARDEVSALVHAFHKATVTAETSGRVLERLAEPGDAVEPGDVLFQLDASRPRLELDRAVATIAARQTDLAHARRELERGRKLMERNAISEQKRDDLEYAVEKAESELALAVVARDSAKRALEDATIRAPFAGVVEDDLVDVGDFVTSGVPVATVVELSRVRLRAGVTAAEASRLAVGMNARAQFAALGGDSLEAELKSIGLVADPTDGTYVVEFWVENPDGHLRDGMIASVELPAPERDPHPLVPRGALLRREGRTAVFVVEGMGANARAFARLLRIGRSQGNRVEVLEGLREGERVVVDGHFALSDGAAVVPESNGHPETTPPAP